jgi:hypothetical protein
MRAVTARPPLGCHRVAAGCALRRPGVGGRLLEVLPGRTGKIYAASLAARDDTWEDAGPLCRARPVPRVRHGPQLLRLPSCLS